VGALRFAVSVRGTLRCISQLFLSAPEDLEPFVFALPPEYNSVKSLMCWLGVSAELDGARAREILSAVAAAHARLPDRLQHAILRLFLHFSADSTFNGGPPLMILTTQMGLHSAADCFFIDDPTLATRIDISCLHIAHQALPLEVCLRCGVRPLGSLFVETLVEMPSSIRTVVAREAQLRLQYRLHSEELATAVRRLFHDKFLRAPTPSSASLGSRTEPLPSVELLNRIFRGYVVELVEQIRCKASLQYNAAVPSSDSFVEQATDRLWLVHTSPSQGTQATANVPDDAKRDSNEAVSARGTVYLQFHQNLVDSGLSAHALFMGAAICRILRKDMLFASHLNLALSLPAESFAILFQATGTQGRRWLVASCYSALFFATVSANLNELRPCRL